MNDRAKPQGGPISIEARLYHPITEEVLRILASLAASEQQDFFERNPSTVPFYRNSFLIAALCQGAALHFLGEGNGVKDFDIHLFYRQHPQKRQLSRAVYSRHRDFPVFGRRRVDFIRTVIPEAIAGGAHGSVIELIRAFLQHRPTANAYHLSKKAVVGLFPDSIIGTIIWPLPA